jgi:hypothetical protein
MGVRLVLGGGDLGFMNAAATERAKMLRACVERRCAMPRGGEPAACLGEHS